MNETPDTAQRPAQPVVATGPLLAELDRRIAEACNRSFDCGEWARGGKERYDIVPIVEALQDIVQGKDGDKAHRAIGVARRALSSANADDEPRFCLTK